MVVSKKNRSIKSDPYNQYRNTLGTRYASSAMSALFSERHRAEVWRDLWIYLAEEERKLGLPISLSQVQELKKSKTKIDFVRIREIEKKNKHDVMSHLIAFAEKAPKAEPILHLGATSCFITDNADAVILQEATKLLQKKIIVIIDLLGKLMLRYKSLECSGFTHFQPAQPVTVGKRLSLWAQDLIWDFEELSFVLERFRPLGCKGTTGTQASFMVLFKNKVNKVRELDQAICKKMGFEAPVSLSGQTLSRKTDVWFLHALANLGSSFSKLSHDMRLLQHLGEISEPFAKKQIGSSAMAYKQNPMLAERITGLSRFLMTLSQNGSWTHATQWLERSLDDSSNRRLVLPEAFLTADALCEIAYRILNGLKVNKKDMAKRLKLFSAQFETEAYMMEGTLEGKSRQKLHEEVRASMLKGRLKKKGLKYRLSGASAEQVDDFSKKVLKPLLRKNLKGSSAKLFGADSI